MIYPATAQGCLRIHTFGILPRLAAVQEFEKELKEAAAADDAPAKPAAEAKKEDSKDAPAPKP